MCIRDRYFVAAELSLPLAIPPGYATAVWPPSGIALGAMLVLGLRVWPAILAGAFVANAVMFLANQVVSPPIVLAVSGCIAVGNTLEALAAGALFSRWIGKANPLERTEPFLKFIAAVSAACGTSSGSSW